MAYLHSNPKFLILFILLALSLVFDRAIAGTFDEEIDIVWGEEITQILDNGTLLILSLDTGSGSGFQSKNKYLFGRIELQIKLVEGDSAGTVCTFYIASSDGPNHDEVDFEFLGNSTGEPYVLHTNVFAHGEGGREQQFYLWFDPTADFHTYTVLWNPQHIALLVDDVPIRDFKNHEPQGLPFPNSQPMRVHGSIWDADGWATRGGLVKTNWSHAPFTVSYQGYNAQACIPSKASWICNLPDGADYTWFNQVLDQSEQNNLKWVHDNYMIYNYCTDERRFPDGYPPECYLD